MTDSANLTDIDQLEEWLETQDDWMSRTIAARVSLRSLPAVMAIIEQKSEGFDSEAFLTVALRATLVAGVASTCQTPGTKALSAALSAADSAAHSAVHFAALSNSADAAALFTADFAAFSVLHSTILSTTFSANLFSLSHEFALPFPLSTALHDCNFGKTQTSAAKIFEHVLWPPDHHVPELRALWLAFATRPDPANIWQFWRDWYQGMLDGTPMDWDLQLQVALIEDAIWDAGPEAVAAEIERIKQKLELEKEIAELKAQLHWVSSTSSHPLIGDNGGPPLDTEISKTIQKDSVLVRDELIIAEEELAKPAPDPSILSRVAKTLWDVSLRLAKYCGQKLDVALTDAAKAAGKAGGVAVVTVPLTTQNEGIQSVAKAIWAFVKTLLGS